MKNKEFDPFLALDAAIMRYFEYSHLENPMRNVSKACRDLAIAMDGFLPTGAEKSAGMRKLLEAKDCFVRASLDLPRD